MNFYDTAGGRRFIDGTMPRLVSELEKLNQALRPKKTEYDIVSTGRIAVALADGWKPVLTFTDDGKDYIIVEREVCNDR